MKNIVRALAPVIAAVSLSFAGAAQAEAFPDRPVSMIVSYSAGGATDFQARLVSMMAADEDALGQPIVVLNKAGAGGQVGWNWFVTKAKADGYDLAAYNIPHFIAQSIVFDTKYNTDNLEPIANWGADPAVLVVGKDSPFDSVADLVNYAKENPGKVTVSGAGLYVGHHVAMLQLAKAAGIDIKYIPTQGGVNAMQFVLGGKVMAGFNNLSDTYRSKDELKVLAIADLQRDERFLPEVPTFKELGLDIDDSSVNFRGVMVPKGTPQHVIDKLAERMPQMFRKQTVVDKMAEGGSPMRVMSRAEVQKMWSERQAVLKDLLAQVEGK
jgi:tripartite-type tricarboxylate transporter receptor subunit TctC